MLAPRALQSQGITEPAPEMEPSRQRAYEDAYNAARMKVTSGYTPTGIFGVGAQGRDGGMGKLNPSLYTPESLQTFVDSGMNDYSLLKHRWGLGQAPSGYTPVVDDQGRPSLERIPGGPKDIAEITKEKEALNAIEKEFADYQANIRAQEEHAKNVRADNVKLSSYNSGLDTIDNIYKALETSPNIGRVEGNLQKFLDDPVVAGIESNLTMLATQYAKSVNGARVTDADVQQAMNIVGSILDGPESLTTKLGNIERMFKTGKMNIEKSRQDGQEQQGGQAQQSNEDTERLNFLREKHNLP
jgi:hypothetical protein